jgi:Ca2+-binding EF-hand superfamily protein
MSAFRLLDTDGDGKVTRDELKQLGEEIKMSCKDLDDLINTCDRNKDGVIDYSEFIYMMTHEK